MRLPSVKGATFDVEFERFKLLLLIAAFVTLVVSGFYTVREVRYALFGKFVTAKVTNLRETVDSSNRRPRRQLRADYEIAAADGDVLQTHEHLPLGYPLAIGQETRLQHLPGVPQSTRSPRLAYWMGPSIFAGMMAVMISGLIWLIYHANA